MDAKAVWRCVAELQRGKRVGLLERSTVEQFCSIVASVEQGAKSGTAVLRAWTEESVYPFPSVSVYVQPATRVTCHLNGDFVVERDDPSHLAGLPAVFSSPNPGAHFSFIVLPESLLKALSPFVGLVNDDSFRASCSEGMVKIEIDVPYSALHSIS